MKKRKAFKIRGALRAIGAFRSHGNYFEDSLRWEINSPNVERAAQPIELDWRWEGGNRLQRGVHLLFAPQAVRRVFASDCWSERDENGRLYPTRNYSGGKHSMSTHAECFLKKGVRCLAVVIDTKYIRNLRVIPLAEQIANENGLDVIEMSDVLTYLKLRKYKW